MFLNCKYILNNNNSRVIDLIKLQNNIKKCKTNIKKSNSRYNIKYISKFNVKYISDNTIKYDGIYNIRDDSNKYGRIYKSKFTYNVIKPLILYDPLKQNILPNKLSPITTCNKNNSKSLILYKPQNKELLRLPQLPQLPLPQLPLPLCKNKNNIKYDNLTFGFISGFFVISLTSYGYIIYCNLELLCFMS